MNIHFEKANLSHIDIIWAWLAEPFVQEFWDNTQGHKDDILNFVNGRKEPSEYCDGKYVYWIASCDGHPFAMLMTIQETAEDHIDDIKLNHLSKTGRTYGIDYMIGDKNYFGKGYGAKTLIEFFDFFIKEVDFKADTFLIDPASDNPRAKHVYMKAGFEHVDDFVMSGEVSGAGKPHHLLIKRFGPNIQLIPATLTDYPTIQNMARFYVYDRTSSMGWECPESGLFECIDFKHYFETPEEEAFLIRVNNEIAGFVLLDKMHLLEPVDWNMGEFFVLAKFQGKGIASIIVQQIFNEHPGKWSVAVMPENIKAVKFWRKIISAVSLGEYTEVFKTEDELKTAEHPEPHPMIMFTFDSSKQNQIVAEKVVVRSAILSDISFYVALSHNKRRAYEKAQPQFWRYVGVQAEISQAKWFEKLLTQDDYIMLTAENNGKIVGFIIGKLISAPEVYNPGGLTLMIDDFCVEDEADWNSTGCKLVQEIKTLSKTKGTSQILVVCGAHDEIKRHFLKNIGLSVASEWYVGGVV
jgi:predicted acetyltransferase/RimJ/RimL family protein N-acetyltransferase